MALPKDRPRPTSDPTLEIHLTGNGQLWMDRAQLAFGDARWLKVLRIVPGLRRHTLDELSEQLAYARDYYELHARQKGGTGFTVIKGEFSSSKYSKLNVLLRADRSAPERHLQWLLCILAEHKYYRVWLAVTSPTGEAARVKAYLPAADSFTARRAPSRLAVHVVPRTVVKKPWGSDGAFVTVPTAVTYRTGKRTTNDLADVARWIRKAKGVGKDAPVTEIWTASAVPIQDFLRALSLFHREGLVRVGFYRNAVPTRKVRESKSMPYPEQAKLAEFEGEVFPEEPEEVLAPTAAD
ncbi:MAG: hypothetical protein ACYSUM_16350 [Planctomycetota bacterium]